MSVPLDKKIELKDKFISYLKENKKKYIFIVISILIFLMIFFIIDLNQKKKNTLISEKYIKAGVLLSEGQKDSAKAFYEEIILSENKFYSFLALNIILEKNLVSEKDKIINYFNILEKGVADEHKDLLIIKKALYLLKEKDIQGGNEILNNIIKKNSNFKSLAEEIIK